MIRWFRLLTVVLLSVDASLKSIAVSLSTLVAQNDGLNEAERAALAQATADLKARSDALAAAIAKGK